MNYPFSPIVDSNILISFFIEDIHFEKSKQIMREKVYINDFILCEVSNFIQNKISSYQALKTVNYIFENPEFFHTLPTEKIHLENAKKIMNDYRDNKFTLTDSLILAQGEYHQFHVLTQDLRMQNFPKINIQNPFL